MKVFLAIVKWGIRLATIIVGLVVGNLGTILFSVVMEVGLSFFSLFRVTPDQIIAVITGFDGNGNRGYYELNDNSGARILGFLCLIGALVFKVFLCIYIFTGGARIIVPVVWF